MESIVISTDLDGLPKALRKFIDQVPYASSQALNQTAYKLQQQKRNALLPSQLNLKNRWTQKGIKYDKASKYDLTATVGSVDWYTKSLVTGGTRKPIKGMKHKGQSYIFIPGADFKTKTGKTKKLSTSTKKAFVINKKGGGLILVRRQTKEKTPLVFLGRLVKETGYNKETLNWTKGEGKLIPKTYRREFRIAMVRAARNAR